MIYLINEALNVNDQRYYYGSVASLLLQYTGATTVTEDNYRLNNNELKIAISDTFTIANAVAVNTVIQTLGANAEYKRVYNVISYVIQSGYVFYQLKIDLWHTYAYIASPENLRVSRCTRDLTVNNVHLGFYPTPKQPLVNPTFTPLAIYDASGQVKYTGDPSNGNTYFNAEKLYLIMALKFNTFQDQSGAVSCVRLYAMNVKTLLTKTQGTDYILLTADVLLQEFLNGIYESRTYVSGNLSTTVKAEIVNAWIIETDLLDLDTNAVSATTVRKFVTRTSLSGWYDHEFTPYPVLASTNSREIEFETAPHKIYCVGTKFNNIQVTASVKDPIVEIRAIAGADTVKVFAVQGDNQVEITTAFSLNLTQVNGDISLQRQQLDQLQNTLPMIASMGTIAVGAMSYNPVAIGGGILSLANSATRYAEAQLPQRMGNLVRSGDAITTYCENGIYAYIGYSPFTQVLRNPYYLIEYEDELTSLDEVKNYGVNYDLTLSTLSSLNTYSYIVTGGAVDGFDYLQCSDMTFSGSVPAEAQEYIFNKLLAGIRIKILT